MRTVNQALTESVKGYRLIHETHSYLLQHARTRRLVPLGPGGIAGIEKRKTVPLPRRYSACTGLRMERGVVRNEALRHHEQSLSYQVAREERPISTRSICRPRSPIMSGWCNDGLPDPDQEPSLPVRIFLLTIAGAVPGSPAAQEIAALGEDATVSRFNASIATVKNESTVSPSRRLRADEAVTQFRR